MSSVKTNQPFLALSKICPNNWHYIDQKVLTFNNGINFFTGHSGSGKSTVIDAMRVRQKNMVAEDGSYVTGYRLRPKDKAGERCGTRHDPFP